MTTEEMIAVMQHFANGGEVQFRSRLSNGYWAVAHNPKWDWDYCDYRIKPSVPKKVKLLAWLVEGSWIQWRVEGSLPPSIHPDEFKRVPSEDKEITLPEDV